MLREREGMIKCAVEREGGMYIGIQTWHLHKRNSVYIAHYFRHV